MRSGSFCRETLERTAQRVASVLWCWLIAALLAAAPFDELEESASLLLY